MKYRTDAKSEGRKLSAATQADHALPEESKEKKLRGGGNEGSNTVKAKVHRCTK